MSSKEEVLKVLKDISSQSLHAKPEIKRQIKFEGIQRLGPEGIKWAKEYIRANRENLVVGGSVATYAQVKGYRDPKDLDLYVANPPIEVNNIVSKLSQIYGSKNVKAQYIPSKKVTRIRVKKNGEFHTVVDVKQLEAPGTQLETVRTPVQKPINVGRSSVANRCCINY